MVLDSDGGCGRVEWGLMGHGWRDGRWEGRCCVRVCMYKVMR